MHRHLVQPSRADLRPHITRRDQEKAAVTSSPNRPVAHFVELARGIVPPMNPAGRPFVLAAAALTLVLRKVWRPLGVVGALLTGWTAWFFREPKRVTPTRSGLAVAPADGTVSQVSEVVAPPELGLGDTPMLRVSVFLSVFDVHVQRVPAAGEVVRKIYHPGKFLSADLDKASEENERNTVQLRTEDGHTLVVVQIAGLVARRIVCHIDEGDKVTAGATYGLIRFGSRVDTYVPLGSRVLVEPGQRTIGGETVLAELGG
ncbi:phosphatidylserine decarboxylase [Kibdelosporangium aridum]|uniref:phosphatidylserine decarboxylase n=1 Tax=Kibdelosporangium aridum TaxID=2030 RepID=UPI000A053D3B|nr:phosphatidylserine decarboxylase [Kibdelosporangium aridum]